MQVCSEVKKGRLTLDGYYGRWLIYVVSDSPVRELYYICDSQERWLMRNPSSHEGEFRDFTVMKEDGNDRAVLKTTLKIWRVTPKVIKILTEKEREIMKKELIEYLKEAKGKEWSIDCGELMDRFFLNVEEVKSCFNSVFFNK